MSFLSSQWFLFIFIVLAAFHLLPPGKRKAVLLVSSLIFPFLILSINQVCYLFLYLFSGYLLIRLSHTSKNNKLSILAIFLWIMLYSWVGGYLHSFIGQEVLSVPLVIGSSYILFRVLQLLIEVKRQQEQPLTITDYFLFTSNWLVFLSGPIQRLKDYKEQISSIHTKKIDQEVVLDSLLRITKGIVKVLLLATIIDVEHQILLINLSTSEVFNFKFSVLAISYLGYLYINFSGYMDIVIGIGNLFGLNLPENFNQPFSSKSFLEFWDRWHITLSSWIKDFFYIPLLTSCIRKLPNRHFSILSGIIIYFTAFTLLGLWHGTSYSFLLCGLMLGLGASINVLLKQYLPSIRSNNNVAKPFIFLLTNLGIALVFAHISISIIGFWLSWDSIISFLNKATYLDIFKIYLFSTVLSLGFIIYSNIKTFVTTHIDWSKPKVKEILVGANLFLILLAVIEFRNLTSDIVYQGF